MLGKLLKANFRKDMSHMISFLLIVILSSSLMQLGLMLILGYNSQFERKVKELNSPDLRVLMLTFDEDERAAITDYITSLPEIDYYETVPMITLQTDVAVLESFHTRKSPVTHASFVPQRRIEMPFQFFGYTLRMNFRQFCQTRHAPKACSVSQIGIGKQDDRRHILQRNLTCLVRKIEAVRTARSGQNYRRTLAVTAVEGLQQVRLLGLGRQSGGRSAALYIHHYQRQFGHDSQADGFGFEAQTGAGSGSTCQVSGESCAEPASLRLRLKSHFT